MDHTCHWCGEYAKYFFKTTNRYCCSKYPQQCPQFRKTLSEIKQGTKRSEKSVRKQKETMTGKKTIIYSKRVNTTQICDYGCGKEAKYIFKNGKYCCENDYRKCSFFVNSKKITKRSTPKGTKFSNQDKVLCDYGCGKEAKYIFKNGKCCCSEYVTNCPALFKPMLKKTKKYNKKPIDYWHKKYPFFTRVEEIRFKPGTKEIQVHCKNHNCPNSKEQGGWFTPTYNQLYERIRQLENPKGNGGSYFYCSDECKQNCPLFNLKSDHVEHTKTYTFEEYQTFREHVLKRDNYECQYCGKPAEHVHHERPQKLESFFALDPDLAWSVCSNCHFKHGHKDECSTGKLSTKQC